MGYVWLEMYNIKGQKCERGKQVDTKVFYDYAVYYEKDNYVFIDIKIADDESFYSSMFDYFFSEDKLLRYCENKKNIKFSPSKQAYTVLARHLKTYIDEEKLKIDLPVYEDEIEKILAIEGIVTVENGHRIARKDKIGKIGEYIFCCLLFDYFQFECIIPKIHLQTDYNMSVFGIDAVFFSEKEKMLLFGESKVSTSLENGIKLIKESLKGYEKQIAEEYELVLCNRLYKDKLHMFDKIYGQYTELCIDVEEFIEVANINKIGIPIFIAHGTDIDESYIIKEMKKIPRTKILGLDTVYYFISLPIFDKYKMIATFSKKIREKGEEYYEARHR